MSENINDNLVMIGGKAIQGKSASLRNLQNPEGIWYFGCEAGKKLPFPAKFKIFTITDPYQIYDGFTAAEQKDVHTIIIDSQTYLMDMFESVHIVGSSNTMQGWSDFQQYFKNLMQQYVAKSKCNVIFTAHVQSIMNSEAMELETKIPVKGALAKNGIESYFSTAVTAKALPLKSLEGYENKLLTITEEEEILGYKHVFQTRLTKETVNEKCIRAPMGMWSIKETFINNDCQLVLDRLKEFYK